MSVKSDLNKLKKTWKKAETREGFPVVPDSVYDCRIDTATVGKAKGSKRLQIVYGLTIANGDQAGRKLGKYDGLETEENLEWAKGTLASLDADVPDDISELPDILESLQGTGVEVTVKTKDEFQNVYFNGPIDLEDDDDEEEDEVEDEDEEEEDEEEEDDDEDEDEDDDDDDEEEEEEEKPKRRRKKPAKKAAKKKKKGGKKGRK